MVHLGIGPFFSKKNIKFVNTSDRKNFLPFLDFSSQKTSKDMVSKIDIDFFSINLRQRHFRTKLLSTTVPKDIIFSAKS